MTEKLLTPNQLAENLGVKPFTLLQYRMNGKGPAKAAGPAFAKTFKNSFFFILSTFDLF